MSRPAGAVEPARGAYRTIVADPPWPYDAFPTQSRTPGKWSGAVVTRPLPYASMDLADLCALPVAQLCAADCRLFLWATNRYLPAAFDVMRAWGFAYRQILVWHKRDGNMGGSIAPNSAEFILVGVRGHPSRLGKMPSSVITTSASKEHSRKPDVFQDYFQVFSPAPHLELFARRQRLGWDTWGHEALHHVSLDTPAESTTKGGS